MKDILKSSVNLYGKLIVANLMCIFIIVSFSGLSAAVFSKTIGYVAIGTKVDSQESTELYTHYYSDGEDTKRAEFEEQGYIISENKIRSEVSKIGKTLFVILSGIFTTILLIAFVYSQCWDLGFKDSNEVNFGHKKKDIFKGLRCGLIATIPGVIFLLILAFVLPQTPIVLYEFINSGVYGIIYITVGSAVNFSQLSITKILILLAIKITVPIIAFISYLMGYKNISFFEKIIYKKSN